MAYISVKGCEDLRDVKRAVGEELREHGGLPASRDSFILIKPNFNSNMNALTGNTTDLRLLVSVIECLKDLGYWRITIGEGTSSGFYREKINIFRRLMIDRVAERYGVVLLDLNYAEPVEVSFEGGVRARVARVCLEADYFINLPKLKMHFETGMSACLKNLVGCLRGVYEKQKAHRSLFRNIINLNRAIRPDFHIVDALVAMEGTGPSSGTPVKCSLLIFTDDPCLGDLACAKVAGVPYEEVPTLRLARREGLLRDEHFAAVDALGIKARGFRRPYVNPLVRFVNNPRWQRYIVSMRLAPGIREIFAARPVGRLLNLTGLRQDVFIKEELELKRLYLKPGCTQCGVCEKYCPIGELNMPGDIGDRSKGCIECLYCYLVCPYDAVGFEGKAGFFAEQIRQYGAITKRECRPEGPARGEAYEGA